MTWTSYNMVATITQGANTVAFTYDTAHMRILQEDGTGRTFYYTDPVSGIKIEKFIGSGGASQWNEYLIVAGEMVGEHFTKTPVGGTPVTTETRYFVKDHLGSVAVLTDETGTVTERLSYDAWGKRRFPDGTDDPTGSITSETTRGFTGHEMIDAVGLVNMNGRIYDPQIGRFLSADPYIHDLTDTQDLNRYSYVHNNPLSLTDPDGYGFFKKFWRVLVAIVVAVVLYYVAPIIFAAAQVPGFTAGVAANATGYATVVSGVGMNAGAAALSAGVAGAASGAVTGGGKGALTAGAFSEVGSFVGTLPGSAGTRFAASVGLHGVVGGLSSVASGGKFLSGFLAAGISDLAGPLELEGYDLEAVVINTAEHAIIGGFGSVLGGGKFAS